jgi:hypothetical protein
MSSMIYLSHRLENKVQDSRRIQVLDQSPETIMEYMGQKQSVEIYRNTGTITKVRNIKEYSRTNRGEKPLGIQG